jgi:hypothetical protein
MKSRRLDEIISDLEDVTTDIEEAREAPLADIEALDEAELILEQVTDSLEEEEEGEEN